MPEKCIKRMWGHSVVVFAFAICLVIAKSAVADSAALAFSLGKANDGINVYRVAWHKSWSGRWFVSDNGELTGFHAISLNRWQGGGDAINAIAYSPVFVYRANTAPITYLKFGVGAAWLSDTRIQSRNLGSHFQFEDQLGLGWQWGRHDLSLAYMHYSNAGFTHPNDGIDSIVLAYAIRL